MKQMVQTMHAAYQVDLEQLKADLAEYYGN